MSAYKPYPFLDHYTLAKSLIPHHPSFVKAGWQVHTLTAAWNAATCPCQHRTDHQMRRASQYARAIRGRMRRLHIVAGWDYMELTNGCIYPGPQHQWVCRYRSH